MSTVFNIYIQDGIRFISFKFSFICVDNIHAIEAVTDAIYTLHMAISTSK